MKITMLAINLHNGKPYEDKTIKYNGKQIINTVFYPASHKVQFVLNDNKRSKKFHAYEEVNIIILDNP